MMDNLLGSPQGCQADRATVVAEALKFLGAPYEHMGRNYGGVDCIGLAMMSYIKAGVVPYFETEYYPPDWAMHRDDPRLERGLAVYAKPVDRSPQPADLITYRFGRCASHVAIVIAWPLLIHAARPEGKVGRVIDGQGLLSADRRAGVWSVWP